MVVSAEERTEDDPQLGYVMGAWSHVSEVLGEEFLPYLPTVVPPLLRIAENPNSCYVADGECGLEQLPLFVATGGELVGFAQRAPMCRMHA